MIYNQKIEVTAAEEETPKKPVIRPKRNGTVILKQKDGFPMTAKLHDVSPQSLRAYIEIQIPLGKDYYLDVQVYFNGKLYNFSCIATCTACSLNGRGFLSEFQYRSKNDKFTSTLAEIL